MIYRDTEDPANTGHVPFTTDVPHNAKKQFSSKPLDEERLTSSSSRTSSMLRTTDR